MHHIAIDLGSRKSQVCVRDKMSTIIEEMSLDTRALSEWLGMQQKARVIVETCAESFTIAMAAKAHGHEVRVVPATLVKQLGVGERRLKNDKKDARKISEVSTRIDLPSVHIPSAQAQQVREVCNMREALVESRTKLINSVRAYARTHICHVASGEAASTPKRMRAAFGSTLPASVECRATMTLPG